MEPLDWQKVGLPDEPNKRRRKARHEAGLFNITDEERLELQAAHEARLFRYAEDALAQRHVEGPPFPKDHLLGNLVANAITSEERTGKAITKEAFEAAVKQDMVNLPGHYARYKIEPIRFICENKLDFFQGNVVKYIVRHDAKNGREDILKVIRYANMYLRFLDGDPDWWKSGKPEDLKE